MHHLYPSFKGDLLCPLGFHPQTRYPTRCKRCFRDYKEHTARRGSEDVAASSPNLSDNFNLRPSSRTWTSTQNLSSPNNNEIVVHFNVELKRRPQSWTSTPDLDDVDDRQTLSKGGNIGSAENDADITVKLPMPPRRHTTALDLKEVENPTSSNVNASSSKSSPLKDIPEDLIIRSSDSLAERARKINTLKKQRSQNSRESSRERSIPKKTEGDNGDEESTSLERSRSSTSFGTNSVSEETKHLSLPPKKPSIVNDSRPLSAPLNDVSSLSSKSVVAALPPTPPKNSYKSKTSPSNQTTSSSSSPSSSVTTTSSTRRKELERQKTAQDVEFMLNIKDNHYRDKKLTHDNLSITTELADVGHAISDHERAEEIKNLRLEFDAMKTRAEKAEREKSDLLLRRLASMETAPNRTAASEALMLQKKVNELKDQLDKISEEKRKLNTRMKDLENNPKSTEHELRRKLQAAEQICEELMEENQEAKTEIVNLQAEMDELQDTFREDDAKAKTSLQKDLEKTTKNCRILSFKLKKCERKIETLEQERQNSGNEGLNARIKQLEEELRFSNELTKKLQIEAEELRNPGKKKTPTLGVLGKSTSADGRITRESLTRGGSQEDPQQLLRDLQDSVERESDLKDQLKFAEEEAENLRKKVARMEDDNDSLMMQLKKMATRSRSTMTQKLSSVPPRVSVEINAERDEGISDEDDPAELRILLELNEQEASILRQKVEELEKENSQVKNHIRELQDHLRSDIAADKRTSFASFASFGTSEKRLKSLNEELDKLKKSLKEKDIQIGRLQASQASQDVKTISSKLSSLEGENERLQKEVKCLQLQALRSSSSLEKVNNSAELATLKDTLNKAEGERDILRTKLKRILQEAEEKLPPKTAIRITDLTPKNQLKKWLEELGEENNEMRAIVLKSDAQLVQKLVSEKKSMEEDLNKYKEKLKQIENELQTVKVSAVSATKMHDLEKCLKKSEEEARSLNNKIKELEEKIKKQDNEVKQSESNKCLLEQQTKADKEKFVKLEKDYEKERKEREKLEGKLVTKDSELQAARKITEKTKQSLEKEIKELKSKGSKTDSKQILDLKKQIEGLQESLASESKRCAELNSQWEKLSEETILSKAQLTTEKANLQSELNVAKQKISDLNDVRANRNELTKKLNEAQKKIQELEQKCLKFGASDYEKTMLQNKLAERNQEYDRLRRENEMNIDLVFQLRKDNDELNKKLNDFSRIEQIQSSINTQNAALEIEVKSLKTQLENTELQMKSEVAATRLRYEQQVKNLSTELTSMHRQCERFKKDRDAFKQMLESAQKKIGDLKANSSGRQSRTSMHSSDEDDKSKIAYLEQQIGCLEDQLVESRLEVSKVKTELVSERSANEIKISEMQSKLNEFEEERVIGSGRTKIPGMKTKLELSWQKEREEQQRLLQETSTLARDLRQTLFEVERERDKERLESKRRTDQLKRANEEEMEEGRKKIAELQCDLLELRDVHAKLRTSNEKLRRERERYEKELIKRRMEQEGGERKIGSLLHTVDELLKIAPNLNQVEIGRSPNELKPCTQAAAAAKRSRSPSPSLNTLNVGNKLARLAEASEEFRKFQRINEEEHERSRLRRNLRRAASQENDTHGSQSSVASAMSLQRNGVKLSRTTTNGSVMRKSLSLDQSIQRDQNIWCQDEGSVSSMQSIDSELGGLVRDSSMDSRLDSRLSGGSTQSDIPRGPRKKKKGLIGKLRSLTMSSRNSESEISIQGSDSDISVASDMRASKKDLRNRFSGMFKRSGSTSRSASTERAPSEQRPVAVTIVGGENGPLPREPPPANSMTPKPIRSVSKPPTPTPTTPLTRRRLAK
ncbi:putative leucine-rich repeat-containing protein DDB_G0290503 isoform X1 [Glossina fuscipes]|uniref:Leucine-rich repeat-containing protein DDB_G0290503 isoform X1 n=1 Tax=Glossina fuscipes TaxID=7396 RepID=A0A9C6DW14_9MUSC|nr:putative leucine-rich repeat-containing protein DDB_G0290503 isoform X1 [Glossina fuscipes]